MAGEEFPVYRSKEISFDWKTPQDISPGSVFYENGNTAFKQGNLGDCWLAAAIESLKQDANRQALMNVINESNELEFRFWQNGSQERIIQLNDASIPTMEDGTYIFMHSIDGNEYWGILIEKAYAKWVGSYEGLEGGYWTDAVQSFTGGIVERIKLNEYPDNLFDIMLDAYNSGSFLCCIKKDLCKEGAKEKYHSCCINVVKIEENTGMIQIRDPYTQECSERTFEDFTNEFDRLDMCHSNIDYLGSLYGRNVGSNSWEAEIFTLQFNENNYDEYTITLTEPDEDDDSKCTIIIEVVQNMKPNEGEEITTIKPWDQLIKLVFEVQDEMRIVKFPQQTYCFSLAPGSHDIKITKEAESQRNIFMRVFSKKGYQIEHKD